MATAVLQRPDHPTSLPNPQATVWLDVQLPTVEENLALDEAKLPSTGRRVERRGTSDLAMIDTAASADTTERKVSGNALRVRRHGVLYHGTLLDSFDLNMVNRVLRHPPREPDYRERRPHTDFIANLGLGRPALERIVRTAFHATIASAEWPRDRVARLARDRYAASDWTGRL